MKRLSVFVITAADGKVKVAHFGGGDLDSTKNEGEKPSRKDIIADLIARTRQARENKQNAKDDMETATEELDAKYLKILDKVKNAFRPVGATKSEKTERDDYDKLAISLKIDADARATPAERTKTAEELAVEEKLHLEELESLRLARMNAEKNKRGHVSADADISSGPKKKTKGDGFEVRFDSTGAFVDKDKVERVSIKKVAIDSDDELTDEEMEDENEEELNDLIDDHDAGETGGPDSGVQEESDKEEEEGTDNEGESVEEDSEDEQEESECGGEEEDQDEGTAENDHMSEPLKTKKTEGGLPVMAKEDLQIPFIFKMPTNYDALVELLKKYPSQKIEIVLERLIKCHHPSLAEGNKKLLSKLFLYLLRFYDDLANSSPSEDTVKMLGSLIKVMYSLLKVDVEFSVRCVRALIRQNWKKRMSSPRSPSSFSLTALLRLIASLFPVSDRWHPVCSPAMALAAVTLSKCHVDSLTALARQILLVTVVADFVEESK
ncbi:hypothetical protein OESDEN_05456, partial [Oesophagostomum dentatum]